MPTSIVITIAVLLACIAVLILFSRKEDKRSHLELEERQRTREVLESLPFSCDGRSLTISRPETWDDDRHKTVTVLPQLRQVFRVAVPGHEPTLRYRVVDDGIGRRRQVVLPEGFDDPVAIRPCPHHPITADQLREQIMPRLAAELNLEQAGVDATTVELAGHELRYVVEHNYLEVGRTEWVDYRPLRH